MCLSLLAGTVRETYQGAMHRLPCTLQGCCSLPNNPMS
jgi:hypothetical protein